VDPDVERLAGTLEELAALLGAHAEARWASWVAHDAVLIRLGDGHGVTHFLSAFGGMGSLGDVVFVPADPSTQSSSEADAATRRLQELRSTAWRLANDLRHEAEWA
jgi:hypothetical protein